MQSTQKRAPGFSSFDLMDKDICWQETQFHTSGFSPQNSESTKPEPTAQLDGLSLAWGTPRGGGDPAIKLVSPRSRCTRGWV